jgi:hypothetical protein
MFKKLNCILLMAAFILSGCAIYDAKEASSLEDVSIIGKNGLCVRDCLNTHANCTRNSANTFAVDVQANLLKSCKSNYKICVQTCPAG